MARDHLRPVLLYRPSDAPEASEAGQGAAFSVHRSVDVEGRTHRAQTDEEFNAEKKARQERIDRILDKISKVGYDQLTKEEKDFLFRHGSNV